MSRSRIPPRLRRVIEQQALGRCGYCLTSSTITGSPLEIDHLIPECMGGETVEDDLWLACPRCNALKALFLWRSTPSQNSKPPCSILEINPGVITLCGQTRGL